MRHLLEIAPHLGTLEELTAQIAGGTPAQPTQPAQPAQPASQPPLAQPTPPTSAERENNGEEQPASTPPAPSPRAYVFRISWPSSPSTPPSSPTAPVEAGTEAGGAAEVPAPQVSTLTDATARAAPTEMQGADEATSAESDETKNERGKRGKKSKKDKRDRKRERAREAAIPQAERTRRPGWFARLFHWGR